MSISIVKDASTITLKGAPQNASLQTITSKSLNKLLHSKAGVTLGCICMMEVKPPLMVGEPAIPSEIQALIQQYEDVFEEPQGLPPAREQDHTIPLLVGSQPVNQRGYRVPYVQKAEIERQIQEML